jgi:GNAT superfamily N-acetyltransferase
MRVVESAFDSEHYQLPVARLVPEAGDGEVALERALTEARDRRFAVAFLRVSEADPLRAPLERARHQPLETLVTSRLTEQLAAASTIDVEHHDVVRDPAIIETIARITAGTITHSHLHADPRLPVERTRELYAAWARNDARGRAARILIARAAGEVVGYLSVVATGNHAAIDLVAACSAWHGRGVGSSLLANFVTWVREQGLDATVGTQETNPALRLYARFGFVPIARHVTYHLWLA